MNRTPALLADYRRLWDTMKIRPEWEDRVSAVVRRISGQMERYQEVAVKLGGTLPWEWIGSIHNMESGGDFSKHLHNGDPLRARTRRVPAGRPLRGEPPFTWEDSALDALQMKGLSAVSAWTIEEMLFQAERYNGFGYRLYRQPILSPYLWSGTNHYLRGKYVGDGKWSATATSAQVGVAAILCQFFQRPKPQPKPSPTLPVPPVSPSKAVQRRRLLSK